MSWSEASSTLKRKSVQRPPGTQTLAEIAEEMGKSHDKTRQAVLKLVKAGMAEAVPGEALNAIGTVVRCTYYRLLTKRGRK